MTLQCLACNYYTDRSDNFSKHLKTNKHLIKTKAIHIITFDCDICYNSYKTRQSLHRHKKTCIPFTEKETKLLNKKIDQTLITIKNSIDEKLDNIQPQAIYNTNIHNTTNNTVNNIKLSYVDTDVSHLNTSDYKKIVNAVNFCVKMLVWKKHFNKEKPENMNLCISNKKDSYMKVFMKDKWTSRKIDEMIHTLFEENEMQIEDWLQEFNDPSLNDKYTRYTKNKENEELLEELQTDLKQFMYDMTKELGIGKTKGLLTFE
jgi:hypothetical protein